MSTSNAQLSQKFGANLPNLGKLSTVFVLNVEYLTILRTNFRALQLEKVVK